MSQGERIAGHADRRLSTVDATAVPVAHRPRLVALLAADRRAALRLRLAEAFHRIADAARRDLDDGLALPALVVAFALGIVLYFHLPREPAIAAVAAIAALAVAVTVVRRRAGHAARLAATLAAVLLGVLAATFETARVAAPRLDHERTVTVEGRVSEVDGTARGGLRMTVEVTRMEARGLRPETTPRRITATLTAKGRRPEVGEGVRFKARLKPPEGPVMPGGYDFARRAWFDGRGAGGYVLGRAEIIDPGAPSVMDRLMAPIGLLRHAIAERVRESLPGATGAIAAALMVGEQRAIPDEAAEPLRASGLTHIVSISGLHMSLVAGGVIVALRALLALVPGLALRRPIKKWAAAAALVVATVYLLLSGNQVAALRSHLMLSVALLAVMVDRPAITMHTVAVSAALILAVEPSQVMEPSFLMSYLAVIALVASWDLYRLWTSRRPPPRREAPLPLQILGSGLRQIEGFAVSSLVAGLATAPVIAGVFFRGAPYSILANMAVLPVTGLLTMPAAVVAALAMPFGLDHWPLQAMGLGIDWMVAVGRWTAALPGGAGVLGAPHPAMMPLGIAAVLWISAWKSRIRLFGVVPALLALGLVFVGPRPDVMIGRHGAPIAARGGDGRLHVLGVRDDRFATAIWLAADADTRLPSDPGLDDGWRCDGDGCVFTLTDGRSSRAEAGTPDGRGDERGTGRGRSDDPTAVRSPKSREGSTIPGAPVPTEAPPVRPASYEIAVVRRAEAFAEDCRRAALVITTLVAPPGCRDRTTVVDRIDLARTGATTITFTGSPRPIEPGSWGATAGPTGSTDAPSRSLHSLAVDPTEEPSAAPQPEIATPGWPIDSMAPPSPGKTQGRATSDPSADRKGESPSTPMKARASPGRPAESASETAPELFAAADPDDDLPPLRREVHRRTALPALARPWTPVDPMIERMAREAAEAEERARYAASTPTVSPSVPEDDEPPEPMAPEPPLGP